MVSTKDATRQAEGLGYPCDHCGEQVLPEERQRQEVNAWLLLRANEALKQANAALKTCAVPECNRAAMALKGLHPNNPHTLQHLSAEALKACRAAQAAGLQFEALAIGLKAYAYAQEWCLPCSPAVMDPKLVVSAFSTALQLWEAQEGGQG